jgi:hypothetical protein
MTSEIPRAAERAATFVTIVNPNLEFCTNPKPRDSRGFTPSVREQGFVPCRPDSLRVVTTNPEPGIPVLAQLGHVDVAVLGTPMDLEVEVVKKQGAKSAAGFAAHSVAERQGRQRALR